MAPRRKITPELVEQMRKLREEGLTYREIGERLGIMRDNVYYHLSQKAKLQNTGANCQGSKIMAPKGLKEHLNKLILDKCEGDLSKITEFDVMMIMALEFGHGPYAGCDYLRETGIKMYGRRTAFQGRAREILARLRGDTHRRFYKNSSKTAEKYIRVRFKIVLPGGEGIHTDGEVISYVFSRTINHKKISRAFPALKAAQVMKRLVQQAIDEGRNPAMVSNHEVWRVVASELPQSW